VGTFTEIRNFGCTRILLVSNQNRIVVNGRRASRISSIYDETWEEMGAIKRSDGNFELPCTDPGQDFDLIPSHKRALARRRGALLAMVCANAQSSLEMRKLHVSHFAPAIDFSPRSKLSCLNPQPSMVQD
jgi:uncharacterized protein VirK/YbjX